jgi:hypothetical protein
VVSEGAVWPDVDGCPEDLGACCEWARSCVFFVVLVSSVSASASGGDGFARGEDACDDALCAGLSSAGFALWRSPRMGRDVAQDTMDECVRGVHVQPRMFIAREE